MSTVTEEVKPEDGKPESEKKIFYCEVCKVPCMSSISLQSHYRGAKHRKLPVVFKMALVKVFYACPPPEDVSKTQEMILHEEKDSHSKNSKKQV